MGGLIWWNDDQFPQTPPTKCENKQHDKNKASLKKRKMWFPIYWQCQDCGRKVCHHCEGASDALPNVCDECWVRLNKKNKRSSQ